MDIITYSKTRQLSEMLNPGQVSVKSKNLNTAHYVGRTHNGVTFTVNEDNSISLSGTSTGSAYMYGGNKPGERFFLPKGTYTLSLSGTHPQAAYIYCNLFTSQDATTVSLTKYCYGNPVTFTTDQDYYAIFQATVDSSGVDVDDSILYPQIEEGNTATSYESPFITKIDSKRLIGHEEELEYEKTASKNLNTGIYTGRTHNGVTFTVNSDGTISMEGTSTKNAYLYGGTNQNNRFKLPPGTYTLSGGYSNSIYIYITFYSDQTSTSTAKTSEYSITGSTTFTTQVEYYASIQLAIEGAGVNTSGLTIYPQIEAGEQATEYESPFATPYRSKRFIDIEADVQSLKNSVAELAPSFLTLPAYYNSSNYLTNKCNGFNLLARACAKVSDSFAFVTDMHWTLNAGYSPAILKFIKENTRIDKLFCGGDVCDFVHSEHEPYDAFSKYLKAWNAPIYTAIGNHEYMTSYGIDGRIYYTFNSIGMNRVGNLDRNYFYIDNPQPKIRYVFLAAFMRGTDASAAVGYEADQLTWLQNTALNVDTGWGIVVVTHYTHGLSGTTPVISQNAKPMLDILDAYTGNGEIIAVISGHTHFDSVNNTTGGIPVIVTTCDKCDPWISGGVDMEPWLSDRVRGTIKEQVIDLFLIDRDAKTISRVRVGCPIHYGIDPESWTDLEEETISYDRT